MMRAPDCLLVETTESLFCTNTNNDEGEPSERQRNVSSNEDGNLEYLQSHVVDRNSLLSEREVEKFCGQDGKRLYSQPSEN